MRNMSFAMTTYQVRHKMKFVTRRFGWWFLKPGDLVQPVEKAMGLKKGEKVKRIGGPIRVVSTGGEPLNAITATDCILEGFPAMRPADFVAMIQRKYKCKPEARINRIQFEYTD